MLYESITFVGQNTASDATTITLPTHQTGDLLLMYAGAYSGTTISVPAGWTIIRNSSYFISAYKIAQSSSETSGTWANTKLLNVLVYRGVSPVNPIGNTTFGQGFSSGVINTNYGSLTLDRTDNSSWLSFASLMYDDTNTVITETGTIGTSSALRASSALSTDPIKPLPEMIYTNGAAGNRNTATPISSVSLTAGNLQENDLVLIIQTSYSETPAAPTNSGVVGIQTYNSVDVRTRISYKIMGATPDSQISFSTTSGSRTYAARVLCYRNLDYSDNPIYSISNSSGSSAGAVTPPSLYNPKPQSPYVVIGLGYAGWNPTVPPTGYTATPNLKVIYNLFGSEYTLAVAYKIKDTIGDEIPTAWNSTAANAWLSTIVKFEADQGSYLLLNSHDSAGTLSTFTSDANTTSNSESYISYVTELLAKIQIPPRRVTLTN